MRAVDQGANDSVAVTRRKDAASWLIRFSHPAAPGGRVQRTISLSRCPSRRAAEAEERRLRAEYDALAARGSRGPAYSEAVTRYWIEHGRWLGWAADVERIMIQWAEALADDPPMADLTGARVATVIAGWQSQAAPATINRRLAVLRAIMYRARDVWGWTVPPVPWRKLKQAEPDPPDYSLSYELREAYVAALPPRSRWPVLMAALTGLRKSAVLRIERHHLDWDKGTITVRTKGRAGGRILKVPMTQGVLAVFQAMGALPDVGRIFPVSLSTLRRDTDAARRQLGRSFRPFHDLRHSFAQDLEDAGLGDTVTDALHHSTPTLRRRYAKARLSRTAAAIDAAQRR